MKRQDYSSITRWQYLHVLQMNTERRATCEVQTFEHGVKTERSFWRRSVNYGTNILSLCRLTAELARSHGRLTKKSLRHADNSVLACVDLVPRELHLVLLGDVAGSGCDRTRLTWCLPVAAGIRFRLRSLCPAVLIILRENPNHTYTYLMLLGSSHLWMHKSVWWCRLLFILVFYF